MPVPVPRHSKLAAHPVVKINRTDGQTNQFQTLTRTLPVSPTGPPPSFGTREQWINSLPTWRRTKLRKVWDDDARITNSRHRQDFYRGLTGAGNASVIKGTHADASIPPHYNLSNAGQHPASLLTDQRSGSDGDADDEMGSDYSVLDHNHLENQSQWSASSPIGIDDDGMLQDAPLNSVTEISTELVSSDDQLYERGAFTPVFEDQSPGSASGQDRGSSPLQPVTPFGDYVDRAVASQSYVIGILPYNANDYGYQDKVCGPQCYTVEYGYQVAHEQAREPPAVPEIVTPSATAGYKKLAEPLSEWVANYVWQVCTTGLSLPPKFASSSNHPVSGYTNAPPSYLATSVHSLLLSTLLQPSAVFLAIWYIVRLPVYFSMNMLEVEQGKEARFRATLLGEHYPGPDREAMEASAPFRLIVLGCMLANKWLDDHTFSNKTWHNISNVPIQALNKLESLALDIFAYDLTVSSRDWSQWLKHVMSYHMSLAPTSPNHPQPISRPSTNPHANVRKAIEEIIQAPVACNAHSVPQPVFIGLEERRRERLEKECVVTEVLEIDLDEDGPLREEYLPKRRVSGAGLYRNSQHVSFNVADNIHAPVHDWERSGRYGAKQLPPPAKWSPAADEPIHRDRNRVSGHYVAVQPPVHGTSHPTYIPPLDVCYPSHNWNSVVYTPVKPQQPYIFNFPSIDNNGNLAYNRYPYNPQIPISHSRSQSLSYDQDSVQPRDHMRSYSQSRFEYRCSDTQLTANEFAPQNPGEAVWHGAGHYQYHGSAFAPIHHANYQPAWLRT